jgi:hypothetical protein
MKKIILLSFILLAGCASGGKNFNSPSKQAMNNKINEAAVAQQQYQTGLQSNSTYFGSGNYNVLPNTLK